MSRLSHPGHFYNQDALLTPPKTLSWLLFASLILMNLINFVNSRARASKFQYTREIHENSAFAFDSKSTITQNGIDQSKNSTPKIPLANGKTSSSTNEKSAQSSMEAKKSSEVKQEPTKSEENAESEKRNKTGSSKTKPEVSENKKKKEDESIMKTEEIPSTTSIESSVKIEDSKESSSDIEDFTDTA